MPVRGTPKFNAVALLEIGAISFRNGVGQFTAYGAYVNAESGTTFGKVPITHFSKETLGLLAELRDSIEMDLALNVLDVEGSTTSVVIRGNSVNDDPGGIGEHASRSSEADPA